MEEEKSNEPIEDKSDEPLGGTRPSMLTTHDHVRNIEDKDLIFIQNIIGDYLSQHDVKYEALLEEIKERFVFILQMSKLVVRLDFGSEPHCTTLDWWYFGLLLV